MMNTNSISMADTGGDGWPTPLQRRLAVALLVAGIAVVLLPHIDNGFIYDDHPQIEDNDWLRSDGSWLRPFQTDVWEGVGQADVPTLSYHRPLFTVMNRILYRVGNGSPRIFHGMSFALHLVSVWLVGLVLVQMGLRWRSAYAASCVFAFHPLVGDVVYWAGCLGEQLMLLFFLSTFAVTFIARQQHGPRRVVLLVLSFIFAFAAFLSKETALVLAPLLTIEAWAGSGSERQHRLKATIPLWIATAGYLVMLVTASSSSGLGRLYPDLFGSFSRAGLVLLWDLGRLVVPYPLTLFHDPPGWWGFATAGALGTAALLGLSGTGLWILMKRRQWAFWAAWILLPLIPPLTQLFFVRQTGVIIADRYLLLSLVPWCVVLVCVAGSGLERIGSPEHRRVIGTAILVSVCVAGGAILSAYGAVFKNDEALFTHASKHSPENPIVLSWLAGLHMKQGRDREAVPLLEKAIEAEPRRLNHRLNLGIAMSRLGRRDEAIDAYRSALAIDDGFADAHFLLANSLRNAGSMAEAAEHYGAVLDLDSDHVAARINLGSIRYLEGDVMAAIENWESALSSSPEHVDLLFNLGLAYRALEDHGRSSKYLRRFLERAGDEYDAQKESARRWLGEAPGPW
jgi:tetratricopeptide (TPR) repeat protein